MAERIIELLRERQIVENAIKQKKEEKSQIESLLYADPNCKYFMDRFNRRIIDIVAPSVNELILTLIHGDLANIPKSTKNLLLEDEPLQIESIHFPSDSDYITVRYLRESV